MLLNFSLKAHLGYVTRKRFANVHYGLIFSDGQGFHSCTSINLLMSCEYTYIPQSRKFKRIYDTRFLFVVAVDPCNPNPCREGGTCRAEGHSFECSCSSGYCGGMCETLCSSGNIGWIPGILPTSSAKFIKVV